MKGFFNNSEYIKNIIQVPLWPTLNTPLIAGCFNIVGNYLFKVDNTDFRAISVKFAQLSLTLRSYFSHSEDWARYNCHKFDSWSRRPKVLAFSTTLLNTRTIDETFQQSEKQYSSRQYLRVQLRQLRNYRNIIHF